MADVDEDTHGDDAALQIDSRSKEYWLFGYGKMKCAMKSVKLNLDRITHLEVTKMIKLCMELTQSGLRRTSAKSDQDI